MVCAAMVAQYFRGLTKGPSPATISLPMSQGRKREFRIEILNFDGSTIVANLIWAEVDSSGKRVRNTTGEHKMIVKDVSEASNASEALTMIIFGSKDASNGLLSGGGSGEGGYSRKDKCGSCLESVTKDLRCLASGKGLGPTDMAPNNESALAALTYFEVNSTLRPPELFSNDKGVVRARWKNVAKGLNFWLSFIKPGQVTWSFTFPDPRSISASALPAGLIRGRGKNAGKAPSLKSQKNTCRVDGRIIKGNGTAVDPVMLARTMGIDV